jgi:hypothetical protein
LDRLQRPVPKLSPVTLKKHFGRCCKPAFPPD